MKNLDITSKSKIWFSISALIILAGIVSMIVSGGLNYGIDFTGGSTIVATFDQPFEIAEVRALMDVYDKTATITYSGNDNEAALIKTNTPIDDDTRAKILKDFKEKLEVESTNIEFQTIGATIGRELQMQAIFSLLLAIAGILAYVTFRFEFKFGLAAVITLAHDVFIMIAAYSILKIQVNSSFIASLLTIVGYSINDTIVIFDRIRENVKHAKKSNLEPLVNQSISQTMSRSVNTATTTLLTIVALYIFGVPAIKEFALPLIIGVTAGAYSSIFLAGPIWLLLNKKIK